MYLCVPAEFSDEKTWCRDLQALKAFVWIEWVIRECSAHSDARRKPDFNHARSSSTYIPFQYS